MAYNKSHAMEYDLYATVYGSYVMKTDKYCKGTFFSPLKAFEIYI
ncbi:hypothetical protein J2S09_003955 [Bacillus fengqiuensis]|nr:hypothetical protein [Bacillus fengqiuensis]